MKTYEFFLWRSFAFPLGLLEKILQNQKKKHPKIHPKSSQNRGQVEAKLTIFRDFNIRRNMCTLFAVFIPNLAPTWEPTWGPKIHFYVKKPS